MGVFWSQRTQVAPRETRNSSILDLIRSSSPNPGPDLRRAETSLQSVAVRSTVDLICSLGSELPFDVYRGTGPDRVAVPTPKYLLDPAGDGRGLEDWSYQALMSWLLRGNLYGNVLNYSSSGLITQAELFYPDDVSGVLMDGAVQWTVNGQEVNQRRFLHRRVMPIPGRVLGLSPIAFHAANIGMSLNATEFGVKWFRDGAHPSGILTNEESPLSEEQSRTAKERFVAALHGTREPVVFGKGWKYEAIQLNPNESQFLETQGFSEAQCARIFGPGFAEVLGYETGGSMTYANVDSRLAHLLVLGMNKWLRRLERLLSSMLPQPQYVRINRAAMLETTTLERYQAYATSLQNQWKTVNEVREHEDMKPVAWGDVPATPPPTPTGAGRIPTESKDSRPVDLHVHVDTPDVHVRADSPDITINNPPIHVEPAPVTVVEPRHRNVRRTVERDGHGEITATVEREID
jgi:HK97 family phage portal protein